MGNSPSLFDVILSSSHTEDLQQPDLHTRLSILINELILHNFDELVYLLYRVDVNEHKLKRYLKEHETINAGEMIATLIIERQLEKIKSRNETRRPGSNEKSDEELW